MAGTLRTVLAVAAVLALGAAGPAAAQKAGGTLRLYHKESPPSASILEEASHSVVMPFMAVFNNLVLYKQDEPQNSLDTIVPELAESWSWNADKTALAFRLRPGVRWHDGKPFTARDVQCTWDLLAGRGETKLRRNPRESWWRNLDHVSIDGDLQATFHLKRPQPAFMALLAAGFAPVYPCHVSPAAMRTKPIGTGPFKLAEFRANEAIRLVRNPDYWRPGRPYLDAVEYTIIKNRSTAILSFLAGEIDMTYPGDVSVGVMRDVRAQAPDAVCDLPPANASTDIVMNRDVPPFNDPELRRVLMLALDRQAFIDTIGQGQGQIGGAMLPAPSGFWGLPRAMLADLPGYGGDIAANRETARAIMRARGYGPDNPLRLKLTVRNEAIRRDPAVVLADQLKQVHIEAEIELVEIATWFSKVAAGNYVIGMNLTSKSLDEPDQNFYENYACGAARNYTKYCNPELEKLFEQQSMEADQEKRKHLVWEIDRRLQQDAARPMIYHGMAGTCRKPLVKGVISMVNSNSNGWRFEDAWLDR